MTVNRATYAILAHHRHPRILIRRIRAYQRPTPVRTSSSFRVISARTSRSDSFLCFVGLLDRATNSMLFYFEEEWIRKSERYKIGHLNSMEEKLILCLVKIIGALEIVGILLGPLNIWNIDQINLIWTFKHFLRITCAGNLDVREMC